MAFDLSDKRFKRHYNREKPDYFEQNIIIYCKRGFRAKNVYFYLHSIGYHNTKWLNYYLNIK